MASVINIEVSGIEWDEGEVLPESLILNIESQKYEKMEQDDIEQFIENELSNQTGYCHFGWSSYKINNEK